MSKPFYKIEYYNIALEMSNSMEFDNLTEAKEQVKSMRSLFEIASVKLYETREIKVE